jgi:hypothetical protein
VQPGPVALGADPPGHGVRDFAALIGNDLARWPRVATAAGVRVE